MPITYTISMLQPHTHLYAVRIDIAGPALIHLDLVLPSWTPGSYMVREFARNVQAFAAEADGQPLVWRKTAKDTWQIDPNGSTDVSVRYQVYANELTVRTSHLDASHGYFNGGTVFMYLPERTAEPLDVDVVVPKGWQVTTGLEPRSAPTSSPDSTTFAFVAGDYDELVDCPAECGTHRLLPFNVDGVAHEIALWGHGNEDEARLVADTKRIVEVQRDMFDGLPYNHYTFIVHLTDGRGGGLEHRNSVTNMLDRWTFQPERSYERYLHLTSHELFHVWNVKRIRPETLGPFDYRSENYTRLLWAMEGVTSYYDELLLVRAGLMTPERFLEQLADEITRLQSQPGRHLQSLEQSSFDAWIKLYRPDENSANSSISYYLKGSLASLLLDLEIRQRTGNECSLDDVQRYLFGTYPITGPGIPEDGGYIGAVEAVAGHADGAYREFYERYIAGTEELDYERVLGYAGVRLEWGYADQRDDGAAPAWLGANVKQKDGRTVVATVRTDSPAYAAGVAADDELVALDGWRVNQVGLKARLAERTPGDTVTLTLFRRDKLITVAVVLAAAPHDTLQLVPIEQPDAMQQQIYADWLRREE